jgi:hypothetical protein
LNVSYKIAKHFNEGDKPWLNYIPPSSIYHRQCVVHPQKVRLWRTLKLLDGLNCKSKGEDNEKEKELKRVPWLVTLRG